MHSRPCRSTHTTPPAGLSSALLRGLELLKVLSDRSQQQQQQRGQQAAEQQGAEGQGQGAREGAAGGEQQPAPAVI